MAGAVDAHNAKDFAESVCAAADGHRAVVVDLSGLEFAGVDAISALHAINARLSRHKVEWTMTSNRAVTRLLDLCDPERLIPRPSCGQAAEPA
ncbi:STAS domain-containing protein [Mycolicibacterium sp. S2-37]|uniref:STAS domain-containing protein n=1 Tax=Mycolicibacterium sp. S2-37 TaxID=2810297 RepID=UPI001A94A9CB|nr:STAS domain-containing protein [Mycolicibacterium sp. S2-37]MBO0679906.1 STAS domain-containing protein [Mycolicibacterium sp. S2-37]